MNRIAILGGGMGGLSTAYALTSRPFWKRHYDITVYQLGWRLGGKCASSRQVDANHRSLEHGLHVWLGCYHNAFRMLRDCYAIADWQNRSVLGTVDVAVAGLDTVPCMDYVDGEWYFWPLRYARHPGQPGSGLAGVFSLWHGARATLATVHRQNGEYRQALDAPATDDHLEIAKTLAARMPTRVSRHSQTQHDALHARLSAAQTTHQLSQHPPRDPALHRLWVTIDLGIAVLRGIFSDSVLRNGHESIDGWEFRAWLRHHGAHEKTLESGLLRELYDAGFSYRDGITGSGIGGDWGNAELAAGTAIYCLFQISINYAGSVCYQLNAGMGEVVIAPIYTALRDAGVKFEFFQNVHRLGLDEHASTVAEIHIGQQVELQGERYEPMEYRTGNGIPYWPDRPLADQIKDAHALQGVDLESFWNGWQDKRERVLRRGEDFEQAILAISLAALPRICREITGLDTRVGERWRAMFDQVGTTQTQSAQIWLDRSLKQMGWHHAEAPLDAGPEPYDVWSPMNQVLATECWPESGPTSLHYLCGPLAGDYLARGPGDRDVPGEAAVQVRRDFSAWLEDGSRSLWSGLRTPDGQFDWTALHDPADSSGEDRLKAQYLRANIDPSERYVLSLPGSSQHRLPAGDTGLHNLFVAGDWTRTPFNAGNVEATVMSGLAAAHAVAQRCEGFFVRLLGNLEAFLWHRGLWSRRRGPRGTER